MNNIKYYLDKYVDVNYFGFESKILPRVAPVNFLI